jgi:hypothetical protein
MALSVKFRSDDVERVANLVSDNARSLITFMAAGHVEQGESAFILSDGWASDGMVVDSLGREAISRYLFRLLAFAPLWVSWRWLSPTGTFE